MGMLVERPFAWWEKRCLEDEGLPCTAGRPEAVGPAGPLRLTPTQKAIVDAMGEPGVQVVSFVPEYRVTGIEVLGDGSWTATPDEAGSSDTSRGWFTKLGE